VRDLSGTFPDTTAEEFISKYGSAFANVGLGDWDRDRDSFADSVDTCSEIFNPNQDECVAEAVPITVCGWYERPDGTRAVGFSIPADGSSRQAGVQLMLGAGYSLDACVSASH